MKSLNEFIIENRSISEEITFPIQKYLSYAKTEDDVRAIIDYIENGVKKGLTYRKAVAKKQNVDSNIEKGNKVLDKYYDAILKWEEK
jgi:hypothetical protein